MTTFLLLLGTLDKFFIFAIMIIVLSGGIIATTAKNLTRFLECV